MFHTSCPATVLPRTIEPLEARIAPAAVFTFTEADGDLVTIKTSLGSNAQLAAAITLGPGNQYIHEINLNSAAFAGSNLSVTSTPGGVAGDGFVNVGMVEATFYDLGAVSIDGDLGRIRVGDTDAATLALKSLTVRSMGLLGTASGAASLNSTFDGSVGKIAIKTDLRGVNLDVSAILGVGGHCASLTVGGSVIGTADGGDFIAVRLQNLTVGGSIVGGDDLQSGRILAMDGGTWKIGGSVVGGTGDQSGRVVVGNSLTSLRIGGSVHGGTGSVSGTVEVGGDIGSFYLAGSIVGGEAVNTGWVELNGDKVGTVFIGGDVRGGNGAGTGSFESNSTAIKSLTIKGSVEAGITGSSGFVEIEGAVKMIIGGDVRGGALGGSGNVSVGLGGIGSLTIGGSIIGGQGDTTGAVYTDGTIGQFKLGRDLVGGSVTGADSLAVSGYVRAERILNATIGGSIIAGTDFSTGTLDKSGSIRVSDDIGKLTVKGHLIGNASQDVVISADGNEPADNRGQNAIGQLVVTGNVSYARILAGYDINGNAVDGDASIGTVQIGGDVLATDIVAGIDPTDAFFGDANDIVIAGHDPALTARIAKVIIGGQVAPTTAFDLYGIVAQEIGSLKLGGRTIALQAGPGNDAFLLNSIFDTYLREVL